MYENHGMVEYGGNTIILLREPTNNKIRVLIYLGHTIEEIKEAEEKLRFEFTQEENTISPYAEFEPTLGGLKGAISVAQELEKTGSSKKWLKYFPETGEIDSED